RTATSLSRSASTSSSRSSAPSRTSGSRSCACRRGRPGAASCRRAGAAATLGNIGELIGRQEELAALIGFLGGLRGGPRALVFEGEAGIGKTSLWEEGVAEARAHGACVLVCRPAGSEVQLSFAALGDLLSGVLDEALPRLPP